MFVADVPNVPPQDVPVMIAQASQAQAGDVRTMRTIGVCHPAPNEDYSLENAVSPIVEAGSYLGNFEGKNVQHIGTITILQQPKHGILRLVTEADGNRFGEGRFDPTSGLYAYLPKKGYVGKDSATALVEIAGVKVKVVYFFQAWAGGLGNTGVTTGKSPPRDRRINPVSAHEESFQMKPWLNATRQPAPGCGTTPTNSFEHAPVPWRNSAMIRLFCAIFTVLCFIPAPAQAGSTCDPDGVQSSGSIYRICMPAPDAYNGILVIWAHGFQDAGTPVQIPEDQLCIGDFCIPEVVNGLGFGFATNSYSKTGLAVVEGRADILDLVDIYTAQKGRSLASVRS